MPFFVKPIARGIARQGQVQLSSSRRSAPTSTIMEAELGKSEWFAGDEFSAADIQMSFPLEAAARAAGSTRSRPQLMAFLARIHARPAYPARARARRAVQLRQRLRPLARGARCGADLGGRAGGAASRRRRRSAPASAGERRAGAAGARLRLEQRAASGSSSAPRTRATVLRGSEGSVCVGLAPRASRKTTRSRCDVGILQEARHQHPLQRHPGELAAALRRREIGELRQAIEPPVDRGPVAAGAGPARSRSAGRLRSRRARLRACARRPRARARSATTSSSGSAAPSGLKESLPGSRSPRSSQVTSTRSRPTARAREQESMRKTSWRMARGSPRPGVGWRSAPPAKPPGSRGRDRSRRARRAASRGRPRGRAPLSSSSGRARQSRGSRVGHGERAFLQARAGEVGGGGCARRVVATRIQGPLHAVELDAGRGVVFGELAVEVLDDLP